MSSYPPYGNDGPYAPSTQYPPSGYYSTDQPAPYGYQPQPTPVYQAGYVPQYAMAPVDDPGSGPALTGMILGIVGLFIPLVGIGGLIFSIIGMKSVTRKGMAIAGLVTSIISILVLIGYIFLIIGIIAAAAASTPPIQ